MFRSATDPIRRSLALVRELRGEGLSFVDERGDRLGRAPVNSKGVLLGPDAHEFEDG